METGRVTNAIFPGMIHADAGDVVRYGDLAVSGPTPGQNDRVRFTRDHHEPGWAENVQLLGATLLGLSAAPEPGLGPNAPDSGELNELRHLVSLPGFSANTHFATVCEKVGGTHAIAFVINQADSFYIVPTSALTGIDESAVSPIANIARAHGQILHIDNSAVLAGVPDSFGADVEIAVRSRAWAKIASKANFGLSPAIE